MDNPFYDLSLQIARLQESVDQLLSAKSADIKIVPSEKAEDTILTIAELAGYLRKSKATIHKYKRDRVIPFHQASRTVFFKKSEVDAAMSSLPKKKGAQPHG